MRKTALSGLPVRHNLLPPCTFRPGMKKGAHVEVFLGWVKRLVDARPKLGVEGFVADDDYGPLAQKVVANLKAAKGYKGGSNGVCGESFFRRLVPKYVIRQMKKAYAAQQEFEASTAAPVEKPVAEKPFEPHPGPSGERPAEQPVTEAAAPIVDQGHAAEVASRHQAATAPVPPPVATSGNGQSEGSSASAVVTAGN